MLIWKKKKKKNGEKENKTKYSSKRTRSAYALSLFPNIHMVSVHHSKTFFSSQKVTNAVVLFHVLVAWHNATL